MALWSRQCLKIASISITSGVSSITKYKKVETRIVDSVVLCRAKELAACANRTQNRVLQCQPRQASTPYLSSPGAGPVCSDK